MLPSPKRDNSTKYTFLRSQHDSPKYGQHYTAEEVHDIFAPSLSAVESIRDWLVASGITCKLSFVLSAHFMEETQQPVLP